MNNNSNLSEIISDFIEYVKLKYDFAKLDVVDKLSVLISTVFIFLIMLLLGLAGLLYLSAACAILLGELFGSYVLALLTIGGVFAILCLVVYLFRMSLVVNPVVRLMVKLFFRNNKGKELSDE